MFKFKNSPTLSKFDLDHVPFEEFVDKDDVGREELAKALNLTAHSSWFMPQLVARFGSWQPVKSSTVEGKYSPLETIKNAVGDDPKLKGMYLVACKLNRSALIKGQTTPANANYSTLVPLILSAFKRYHNIPYSSWDREELKYIVEKNLCTAMLYFPEDYVLDFTDEQLLEYRAHGLTTRSGPKVGQQKSALTSWTLTGMKGTPLEGYPSLVLTMLSQIWVAHPSVRTNLMVLDPINWDNIPAPIVDCDIGVKLNTIKPIKSCDEDLPW